MAYTYQDYINKIGAEVKDYIQKNRTAITYVHNSLGYPIGVVLCIGKDKIGYSQVNSLYDYKIVENLKLHQIPAIQRMEIRIREGKTTESLFQSKAYRHYNEILSSGGYIKIPNFNRVIGLFKALKMAKDGTFKIDSWRKIPFSHNKPFNFDMKIAIDDMIEKSHRIKAFQ